MQGMAHRAAMPPRPRSLLQAIPKPAPIADPAQLPTSNFPGRVLCLSLAPAPALALTIPDSPRLHHQPRMRQAATSIRHEKPA